MKILFMLFQTKYICRQYMFYLLKVIIGKTYLFVDVVAIPKVEFVPPTKIQKHFVVGEPFDFEEDDKDIDIEFVLSKL